MESLMSQNKRLSSRLEQSAEALMALQQALEEKTEELEQLSNLMMKREATAAPHSPPQYSSPQQTAEAREARKRKSLNLQDTIASIQVTLAEDVAAAETAMEVRVSTGGPCVLSRDCCLPVSSSLSPRRRSFAGRIPSGRIRSWEPSVATRRSPLLASHIVSGLGHGALCFTMRNRV